MEAAEMVSMLVLFSMMDVGRQRQMNANREVKVTLNPFGISRFRLSNVSSMLLAAVRDMYSVRQSQGFHCLCAVAIVRSESIVCLYGWIYTDIFATSVTVAVGLAS